MTSKSKIKRIAIVGLGLIGGSLAIALKVNGYQIIGITRKTETLELAKSTKVIDEGYTELDADVLNNVELIFLAPPLVCIPQYIQEIAAVVKNQVILTDVGSTKLEICNIAKKVLPENIAFVGGHPMAGTEKSGFQSSQLGLFKKCAWILTPIDQSEKTKNALEKLKDIVQEIGGIPIVAKPEKHDQAVALVSHLPLLASIGLCQVVRNLDDKELQILASIVASSGFRDTTRIGGGNPELNSDLIISNFLQLEVLLPKYYKEIDNLIRLAKGETFKLKESLSYVSEWRTKLYNSEGKNALLIG